MKGGIAQQPSELLPSDEASRGARARVSSHRGEQARLRRLLVELGYVDAFSTTSFHSARNLLFEWETVFPRLRRPGVLLADDVQRNAALAEFTRAHPALNRIICGHSDRAGLFAILVARN